MTTGIRISSSPARFQTSAATLRVTGDLTVSEHGYMVVAKGWRGMVLRGLARVLFCGFNTSPTS